MKTNKQTTKNEETHINNYKQNKTNKNTNK